MGESSRLLATITRSWCLWEPYPRLREDGSDVMNMYGDCQTEMVAIIQAVTHPLSDRRGLPRRVYRHKMVLKEAKRRANAA
jgi:hypothetical protein